MADPAQDDPYAQIAKPIADADDPYASIAKPISPNAGLAPAANSKVKPDFDAPTAGLPGSSPNPQPATEGMTHAAELGIGAAAGGIYGPGILKAAKPFILPAAGSYAISKARDLPVVGPILKHIPFAEMIPWMASGRGKPEAEAEYPGAPNPDTGKIGDSLNEGLGGNVPEGHTPVKGSSVIRSYKYDPATKEFEAGTTGGTYIHGDVSPEQAKDFENASSKGKAWTELKNNSTYVGKIVNGKRIAARPPRDLGSASPDDLTPQLQKSLDAARKARTARVASPR
jgi:hypothetical protein